MDNYSDVWKMVIKLVNNLKQNSEDLKASIYALYRGMGSPRVPWYVKFLTILVVAYIISPIDFIPDFIPVFGLLDELILVSILLNIAIRLIPAEVFAEYRTDQQFTIEDKKLIYLGGLIVIGIWIVLIAACYMLWKHTS